MDEIDAAAAGWLVVSADESMDWSGFIDWLDADPRHRKAYDAIALLDDSVVRSRTLLQQLLPPEKPPGALRRRLAWGSAAAAGIVGLAVAVAYHRGNDASPIASTYVAATGRIGTVEIADRARVSLAPGSRLSVARPGGGTMTFEGRGSFEILHDETRPLMIRVGAYEIRDIGTRFEIVSGDGMLRVAVTEGRVALRHVGGAVELGVGAGQMLTVPAPGAPVERAAIRVGAIDGWRRGVLVYDEMPLGLVVADISRYAARPIELDPAVKSRRFSGVIAPGSGAAMVAALTQLTGLHAQAHGNSILIGLRPGP